MKAPQMVGRAGAVVLVSLLASCGTWNAMDRTEKGTAAGATGGALAGAAVGGPVGAAVGAGVGGYVGHREGLGSNPGSANDSRAASGSDAASRTGMASAGSPAMATTALDSELVRSIQQSLRDRGFDAGEPDGVWGPNTESALRRFQQSNNLASTGKLDRQTLAALNLMQNGQGATASGMQNQNPSTLQNPGTSATTGSTAATGSAGTAGTSMNPATTGSDATTGTAPNSTPGSGMRAQ